MEAKEYDKLLRDALSVITNLKTQLNEKETIKTEKEKVAIIGMACRFPGNSNSPEEYWDFLQKNTPSVVDIPVERWNNADYYDPVAGKFGKIYIKQASFLNKDISEFDAKFYGISAAEANEMDPQQRLLFEVCWEALENAGLDIEKLRGSKTGVFLGISSNCEYSKLPRDPDKINQYVAIGNNTSIASGRISYEFGWEGPSISMDTACSSSLVSTHLSVNALCNYECDLAVSSGINLMISPTVMSSLCAMNALAVDGKSKPFDASADGYGRGEGCGVIILKRLSDALRDNDTIFAVIEGSAINNDGRSSGLTVPNGKAQAAVIEAALKDAQVSKNDIEYIEAHGTGTSLGDPIEYEAIKKIFLQDTKRDNDLSIGAVKGNIGHLESAAGIAGLIKVALSIYHNKMLPITNLETINPRIKIDNLPINFLKEEKTWDNKTGKRKFAGISSFGFSGTNAHMILASYEKQIEKIADMNQNILVLTAKSEKALVQLIKKNKEYLCRNADISISEMCFTNNVFRKKFFHKASFVGNTAEELINGFDKILKLYEKTDSIYITGNEIIGSSIGKERLKAKRFIYEAYDEKVWTAQVDELIQPKLSFVFNGEDGGLVKNTLEIYKVFFLLKEYIDECFEVLDKHFDSIRDDFYQYDALRISGIRRDMILLAIQYSMAKFFRSMGLICEISTGVRVGIYTSLLMTGAIQFSEAVELLKAEHDVRNKENGIHFLRVFAPIEKVEEILNKSDIDFSISVIYSQNEIILSVKDNHYEEVKEAFISNQVEIQNDEECWPSVYYCDVKTKYQSSLNIDQFDKPKLRYFSSITFKTLRNANEILTELKEEILTGSIDYITSMKCLYDQGYRFIMEFGQPTVKKAYGNNVEDLVIMNVLNEKNALNNILEILATCNALGSKIKWDKFYEGYNFNKLQLPTYPFANSKYWVALLDEEDTSINSEPKTTKKFIPKEIILPYASRQYKFLFTRNNFPEVGDNSGVLHMGYYLELIQNIMSQASMGDDYIIQKMEFLSSIMIFEGDKKEVLVTLDTENNPIIAFKIYNKNVEQTKWNLNMTGDIKLGSNNQNSVTIDLNEYKHTYSNLRIEANDFYDTLEQKKGFYFGHAVRWVQNLWSNGREAFVEFRNYTEIDLLINYKIGIHPGILDSCAQACNFLSLDNTPNNKKFMVNAMGNVRINNQRFDNSITYADVKFECYDDIRNEITASIQVFNKSGELIIEIGFITLKEFDEKQLALMKELMDSTSRKGKDEAFIMRYKLANANSKIDLINEYVRNIMANILEIPSDEIDIYEPLDNIGLDSMSGLLFYSKTTELLGVEMPFSELAQCKTLANTSEKIGSLLQGRNGLVANSENEPVNIEVDMSPENWIYDFEDNSDAKVRLFCFPNGFRSADMFSSWKEKLGNDVQVCAIKVPGMDMQRIQEPAPVEVDDFIDTVISMLEKANLLDKPCMSFGHSWGSLFSFRLAYKLSINPNANYIKLFVSGYTSPSMPNSSIVKILDEIKNQGFASIPDYNTIKNDKDAIDLIVKSYQKVWDYDKTGTKVVLQLLLSACYMIDNYKYDAHKKLDLPIVGFHGVDDYVVDIAEMNEWETVTSNSFKLYTMKGDHQFVNENQSEQQLLALIHKEMQL